MTRNDARLGTRVNNDNKPDLFIGVAALRRKW